MKILIESNEIWMNSIGHTPDPNEYELNLHTKNDEITIVFPNRERLAVFGLGILDGLCIDYTLNEEIWLQEDSPTLSRSAE